MQRSAVVSAGKLAIGLRSLLQSALVGVGDDKLQQRIVTAQPRQVHFRQADGGDLLLPQRNAEFAHRRKRPRFVSDFAASLRLRDDLRDVWSGAQPQWLLRLHRRRCSARRDRVRHRHRRHAVRQMQFAHAQRIVALIDESPENPGLSPSIICFCSSVMCTAAMFAAASIIAGVIAGQPWRSSFGAPCCLAPAAAACGDASASRAPGNSVCPNPAAVHTESSVRRLTVAGEPFDEVDMREIIASVPRRTMHSFAVCAQLCATMLE